MLVKALHSRDTMSVPPSCIDGSFSIMTIVSAPSLLRYFATSIASGSHAQLSEPEVLRATLRLHMKVHHVHDDKTSRVFPSSPSRNTHRMREHWCTHTLLGRMVQRFEQNPHPVSVLVPDRCHHGFLTDLKWQWLPDLYGFP